MKLISISDGYHKQQMTTTEKAIKEYKEFCFWAADNIEVINSKGEKESWGMKLIPKNFIEPKTMKLAGYVSAVSKKYRIIQNIDEDGEYETWIPKDLINEYKNKSKTIKTVKTTKKEDIILEKINSLKKFAENPKKLIEELDKILGGYGFGKYDNSDSEDSEESKITDDSEPEPEIKKLAKNIKKITKEEKKKLMEDDEESDEEI